MKYEKSSVYSSVVHKYIENYKNKTNIEIIEEIYNFLSKKYRNEYFYKNTLLTKLLLHRHSLNTTVALTQIPIGKSKADFVLINGKATVYEIKSELDNYTRLASQLSDYFKAFSTVCVVVPECEFDKMYDMLSNSPVGISCLTRRNTFSKNKNKEPVDFFSNLEHRSIFRILHKAEYEEIVKNYFGEIPVSSQVEHYKTCLSRFSAIPLFEAYKLAITTIKKRNKRAPHQMEYIPNSLNSILYFLNPSMTEFESLLSFLNKPFQEG